MTTKYDYTIVGAGPCGLSIAYILSQYNKSVLIIDKHNSVGGCHRVERVDNYFTEHGPRMYSDAYVNTIALLDNMGLDFYDYFVEYNFTPNSVVKEYIRKFSFKEILIFVYSFLKMMIYPEYSRQITCLDFMKYHSFSDEAIDSIDRICRLIGGGGSDRCMLYELLQIINHNVFDKLYQLKRPTDKGLFKDIKEVLLKTKRIDFMTASVVALVNKQNKIDHLIVNNSKHNNSKHNNSKHNNSKHNNSKHNSKHNNKHSKIYTNCCILATPPMELVQILLNSNNTVKNAFGKYDQLYKWALRTNYNTYIQVIFHWTTQLQLPKVYGAPSNDWGIEFIILSDYMDFGLDLSKSKTVISTSISTHKRSTYIKKTPDQCTESELINEVFRQLKQRFPSLKMYNKALLNPNITKVDGKWVNSDTSFIMGSTYMEPKSPKFDNLYSVGTHNNKSFIEFTSMESAITNGVSLCHHLIKDSKNDYPIKTSFTVMRLIYILLVLVVIIFFYKYIII
ncbi:MAG: flavin containing amine oxidoreductase [Homavirus sp.]|uniref:Flavin containing amine oxidoreductase n=1 Tax=Homavirus sp. TaxID=2487769 RepID=A0A3G5A836_9VIRU|nr:MAG: flavin containing amine oxidoreductase [Homavirus sp.]